LRQVLLDIYELILEELSISVSICAASLQQCLHPTTGINDSTAWVCAWHWRTPAFQAVCTFFFKLANSRGKIVTESLSRNFYRRSLYREEVMIIPVPYGECYIECLCIMLIHYVVILFFLKSIIEDTF